ncbi:MAG: helix-turn-helix transcriptional regulator [Coprothermobacterota bacterium]|nr:helix-turn-helix transcriptional regulator [Coprothermobacterota bacterium]
MEKIDTRKIIGRRILRLLQEQKKTVRQWSETIGRQLSTCYSILDGNSHLRVEDLIKTADFLGVSTDYLLKTEEEIPIFLRVAPGESRESVVKKVMALVEDYFQKHPELEGKEEGSR